MKTTKLRFICALLGLLMFFTACSSSESSSYKGGDGSTATISPTVVGTTGKYIQTEITPSIAGQYDYLRQLDDGKILLTGIGDDATPFALASSEGTSWESYADPPDVSYAEGKEITKANVTDDGTWWMALTGEEGGAKLYCAEPGQKAKEISLDSVSQGAPTIILSIHCEGSTTLVSVSVKETVRWLVLDQSGKELNAITPSGYALNSQLIKGKIHTVMAEDNHLQVYDPQTGKQESSNQLPYATGDLTMSNFFISSDQSLCYINSAGIQRVAFGGEIIQTVVDDRGYAYAGISFGASSLIAVTDNSYWLACSMAGVSHVFRYSYDDNAPLYEGNELKIWALDDNQLMRNALTAFAQAHPDITITYELGHGADDGAMADEDIVRNLNTRLISGDAPDVLILDGLPIRPLIDKGLLSDISNLVDESLYYSNILGAYSDGEVTYAYPAMFKPTIMIKQQGYSGPELSGMSTILDMEEWLIKPDLIRFGGYRNVFLNLYDGFASSVFPNGMSVDETALRDFLQVTDNIVNAHGLRGQESDPMLGDGQNNVQGTSGEAYGINESVSLMWYTWGHEDGKATPYGVGTLNAFYSSFLQLQQRPWPPEEMIALPGNAFIPLSIAAVPADAQNMDAGKKFIATMLELQADDTLNRGDFPGFFVRKGINLNNAVKAYEDPSLSHADPRLFDWDKYISSFNVPNDVDLMLKEKLYTEAVKLYTGGQNVDQAVEAVLQGTQLYFAERG